MKLSVCIESVFRGQPLEECLPKVKQAGFSAFEFWSWGNKDLDVLEQLSRELDLKISGFCVKNANLVDPAAREAYLEGLKETLEVAKRLNCQTLIVTVGNEVPGRTREEQRQSIVDGLRASIPLLEGTGVTLAVEPLNVLVNHAGYFLASSQEALEILQEVNHPQVKMLFDIYHQQITEGQVTANVLRMLSSVGHIHAAGNPGRAELEKGELHYPYIFSQLRQAGYEGYVGLEYFPTEDPMTGLERIADTYKELL